ncbi:phosphoethanolamine--lipid A transferase [Marinomonas sp. 15G1-11]|uniref:Phosphoethanolamine--lipid A transferase n=1 Tax=Marinomonas phaeophyticola TaxID=3004091 RepID=A0ABT4JRK6_9GAMM|nr:phosphoethanolamine--lipid A transferase [Marinomonas sp. 15G1-11]MCZ2721011.1 phosphoethanolamine--lipid A transferase [Marinomonas sp. 15G1-11]
MISLIALPKLNFPRYVIILVVALFIAITANGAFFSKVTTLYPVSDNVGFMAALSMLLFALLVLLMTLLSLVIPVKIVSISFIFIATLSAYFTDTFGTVIDSDMIRNTLETNTAEAFDMFTWGLLLKVVFFAVLPSIFILIVSLKEESILHKTVRLALLAILSFAISGLCLVSNGNQFASFFREHKSVRYYVNPSYPIYSAVRYVNEIFKTPESQELVLLNTKVTPKPAVSRWDNRRLMIMVVGETARADHFSLNGYDRLTNEFTSNEARLINFPHISSCGTSTAVSVPCMFAYQGRKGLDVKTTRRTQNILDLLQAADVNVLWRDNNSDSKGVAARVNYQDYHTREINTQCDIECRDLGMLEGLQEYINQKSGDIMIVLHQMGSHGPAYFKRYPEAFAYFQPACSTPELSDCSQQEVINAYDNSIRYTDYFLSKVIALLKANASFDTSMLYVSDHGESLGEAGVYLHGLPYAFAPDAQTHVPMLLWTGESSSVNVEQTKLRANQANSHDALFDTLLAFFHLQTSLSPASDIPLISMNNRVE